MSQFYEQGKQYKLDLPRDNGWRFRVEVITTHPLDGVETALGWRLWKGEWRPYAYGTEDWEFDQDTLTVDEQAQQDDPCQPIGCDNGIHLPGCGFQVVDDQP